MLKPQRLLARRPLDQLPKQRLRALKPRDRARIGPCRAGLLAAHRPPITIHASQRWFAHRAVSLPGAIEQVEQIWSHAITSVSRSERDITSRLSAPPPRTPSETPRHNPGRQHRPTHNTPKIRGYLPTTNDLHPHAAVDALLSALSDLGCGDVERS